ncbi:MAG: hypothetical protein WDN28_25680 [Chthoniobacter sp.]
MTFEPSWNVTADASTDTIALTAHGFANGTVLAFSSLTGGTGLSTATRYFVVNAAADTFQLATTPGGTAIDITVNYTAATLFRPGYLSGAATVPGISTVRLTATNADPATSAEVLFTIGIEPAAAAPDGNVDMVWNFATDDIIHQPTSTLVLTPVPRTTPITPIIFVKEGNDLIVRLRIVKDTTVIAPRMDADGNLKLILKELEPENEIIVSSDRAEQGVGDGKSYLIYAKFDGATLASSLSNYENDQGTFYNALAEFEFTYHNTESVGPELITRTSKTFGVNIERDLGGL